jgi:hypothetical protein
MRTPVLGGTPVAQKEKPRTLAEALSQAEPILRAKFYLRAVETVENVVFNCVPRAATVAMIATAMPAAMRPYSMAVTPRSSFRKRKRHVMSGSSVLTTSFYIEGVFCPLSDFLELSLKHRLQ